MPITPSYEIAKIVDELQQEEDQLRALKQTLLKQLGLTDTNQKKTTTNTSDWHNTAVHLNMDMGINKIESQTKNPKRLYFFNHLLQQLPLAYDFNNSIETIEDVHAYILQRFPNIRIVLLYTLPTHTINHDIHEPIVSGHIQQWPVYCTWHVQVGKEWKVPTSFDMKRTFFMR